MASPLMIEGVRVNVRATAHIHIVRPRGADLLGAIVIDAAKGVEVKTEESKDRLSSGMLHSAILLHQHVAEVFSAEEGKPSPDHCSIFHTHRQEQICAPSAYRKTFRNIEAVCRNISRGWDNIPPPLNFDPKRATYRN
jgi:hypothetical protein